MMQHRWLVCGFCITDIVKLVQHLDGHSNMSCIDDDGHGPCIYRDSVVTIRGLESHVVTKMVMH